LDLKDEHDTDAESKEIVIIEDEPGIMQLLTRILKKEKFSVRGFVNGGSFLDHYMISEKEPDLIILDHGLPDMKGVDCLYQLKTIPLLSNVSVIMMTGESDPALIKEVYLAGASDYLLKPISLKVLKERVNAYLTVNFELEEIHNIITHLHSEQPTLFNANGLRKFLKTDAQCFPILHNNMQLCFIIPNEFKKNYFSTAPLEELKAHVQIFKRNAIRWNQVWPARKVQTKQNADSQVYLEDSYENVKFDLNHSDHILGTMTENEYMNLKTQIVGKVHMPIITFWKSIFRWSEDKEKCEEEIQFWKNKIKELLRITGESQ
jgi:DNA-binding NarL/FixJ family response regulator